MQGDPAAREIFRRFGRALGILLAGMVNVLNLEMYVIGGGVASAWDAFAPTMFHEMRERSPIYFSTDPENPRNKESAKSRKPRLTVVTRAVLGSDAGLYGGARLTHFPA
jgi:glucokinase